MEKSPAHMKHCVVVCLCMTALVSLVPACCAWAVEPSSPDVDVSATDAKDAGKPQPPALKPLPRLAFIGLHGGVFDAMKQFETDAELRLDYITDQQISNEEVDFSDYRVVFMQHVRGKDREQYRKLITLARKHNLDLKIISISGLAEKKLPELTKSGIIIQDPLVRQYYGSSAENLKRLLAYVNATYLNRPVEVLPPQSDAAPRGLYHPDHKGMFQSVGEFQRWAENTGRTTKNVPRVIVTAHSTHLAFQQPAIVNALIRECEKKGLLAVCMTDFGPHYTADVLKFKPHAVIHTCHSRETVDFRKKVGVPQLHSIFFRRQSIADWQSNLEGLAANEMAFHITGQELLGAIEPQIGAGTLVGGGSSEAFMPIPDRIEHLVARAVSWIRLARLPESEKKIAFVYYDREMGKAELMRGTATGMFMNCPRSVVKILKRMKQDGYSISRVPEDEDDLLALMLDHGRQIGIWAPGELDRLAKSGEAILIPLDKYVHWFNTKVPETQRKDVVKLWGPPPGRFLVWERDGEKFIVIPRIDLGNVILLPQPLRGEAHDTSLVHDKLVPPPHNYLATYFWLQEEFAADALVHFGTHGSEFLLPGKPTGLSRADWPDIIMGTMPNINPWIINNLGESSPVRRRAYAVLIDHLVPPSVSAELSDELLNLHNDLDRWITLEDGALKNKFRISITKQVRNLHLDTDLHINLTEDRRLTPSELEQTLGYLHDIHTETTPISLHIFGEPPREDLLIPYLVTCLRKSFIDELDKIIDVPPEESLTPGDRNKFLRQKGEEIIKLVVRRGFSPAEAVRVVAGTSADTKFSKRLQEAFDITDQLTAGFAHTHEEMDNLMAAFDGRYIAPGPGNSPDRNPAVVPTGRNMYVMNPEEVPCHPSWELGKQLVDQLLAQQLKAKGRYPEKIGFTLNSFATFQDYGVMESQILYLLGVRPAWDSRNLVTEVELIPAEELGRPRIDVFIAGNGYYRDMLPTRMRLIDKAIRLVAALDEKDNLVYQNSRQVQQELEKEGVSAARATALAQARIFGYPLGQMGSAGYYYLVERSGEWDSREELMNTYLDHVRYVYTENHWGEHAPDVYNRHIQGTEAVLRSWSDRTRSPLSNKYTWYKGGSLCLAITHLTGKEPEFFLSDVRDPDKTQMVVAEDALRREYRVRLFNRKWIEGMMKEGYAGADQIGVHVSNTMGWKIMRPKSVSDDIWEEIVNIYIRDSKNLNIREWFEAENPFAFQEMTEILLETIRKGYWQPNEATIREIATEYAKSVARHGEGGGLRGGGNKKLEAFVENTLQAPGSRELDSLLAQYKQQCERQQTDNSPMEKSLAAEKTPTDEKSNVEPVEGRKMEPVADDTSISTTRSLLIGLGIIILILLAIGIWKRTGAA